MEKEKLFILNLGAQESEFKLAGFWPVSCLVVHWMKKSMAKMSGGNNAK